MLRVVDFDPSHILRWWQWLGGERETLEKVLGCSWGVGEGRRGGEMGSGSRCGKGAGAKTWRRLSSQWKPFSRLL